MDSRAAGDCFTSKVHRDDMADPESLPPPTRPIEPHDFRPLNNVDGGDVDDNDALADLKMGLGIGGGVVLAGLIGVFGYIAVNRRKEKGLADLSLSSPLLSSPLLSSPLPPLPSPPSLPVYLFCLVLSFRQAVSLTVSAFISVLVSQLIFKSLPLVGISL